MTLMKASVQTEITGKRQAEEDRVNLKRKLQFPTKVFLTGLVVRLIVLGTFRTSLVNLQKRIELVTPVNSLKTVKEGVFLYKHGISPYEGGLFHQSPFFLSLFSSIFEWDELYLYLGYIALDMLAAYLLWRIGAKYLPRAYSYSITDTTYEEPTNTSKLGGLTGSETKIEKVTPTNSRKLQLSFEPWLLPAIYLFNPYSILSCFSLATSIFNHIPILLAVLFAVDQNMLLSSFFLSLATHLTFFPITLFLPLYLLAFPKEKSRTMVTFGFSLLTYLGSFSIFTFAGMSITGSFQYLNSVYGTLLMFRDLTPNVGLFWYFFIEIFHQFRNYFLAAFHFVHLTPVFPLSYRFSDHPILVLLLQLGVASIYKPYPSLADAALYMSFLPIVSGFSIHMMKKPIVTGLLIANAGLGPIFWHAWIVDRSANANFFYASTLVYTLAHTLLLVDIIQAYRKFDFLTRHPTLTSKSLKLV